MLDKQTITLRVFQQIFNDALFPVTLAPNPKYSIGKYETMTPYISYDDVLANRYRIRFLPSDAVPSYMEQEGDIIAEYQSIDQILQDGWMLGEKGNEKDFDGWIEWAENTGMDTTVVEFLKKNPQYWCSPSSSSKFQ